MEQCPQCEGKKSLPENHLWGDGWGTVYVTCLLCSGDGVIKKSLINIVTEEKTKREKLEKELDSLRANIALFLTCEGYLPGRDVVVGEETGREPYPALKLAPHPSPWKKTWLDALMLAANKCDRLSPTSA